jgi:hypothetical protein
VKKAICLFLLLIIMMQSFSRWVIVIEYELNKGFIIKTLCINKGLPQMHCNGKCQVMKKLAEDAERNMPLKNTLRSFDPDPWIVTSIAINHSLAADNLQHYPVLILSLPPTHPRTVFHPPSFA